MQKRNRGWRVTDGSWSESDGSLMVLERSRGGVARAEKHKSKLCERFLRAAGAPQAPQGYRNLVCCRPLRKQT